MKRVAVFMARQGSGLVIGIALAAYLTLSLWHLSYPGLQYDEMLFANAALGGIDTTFLIYSVGRIPLFLMTYIGALKAWLYYPIFHAFGVSVASVRVPMILASAAGLYLFFRLARTLAGIRVAVFAFLLLVTNAPYLWGARVDHGPVVLGTLFEIAGAAAFFAGNGWLLAMFCVLGLFQKIIFLFWIAGFLPAAIIFFPERRRLALTGLATTAIYLAVWCALIGVPPASSVEHGDIPARLAKVGAQLSELLDGSAFWRNILLPHPWALPAGVLAAVLILAGLRHASRVQRFLVGQLALSLVFTCFLRQASCYWHFYGFLPWIYLTLAMVLASWGRAGTLVFALFIGVNVYGLARQQAAIGRVPGNVHYSTAIYPLIDYCAALRDRLCASVSWGMHTQIQAFTWKGRFPEPLEMRPAPDPRFVYVDYDGMVNTNLEGSRNFFHEMEIKGREPTLLHRIDEAGHAVFVIYEFKR